MENKDTPINPCFFRQTGTESFRIATEREINIGEYITATTGLTKREHFAAMAMQGLVSNDCFYGSKSGNNYYNVAERAVDMADALLKELEK